MDIYLVLSTDYWNDSGDGHTDHAVCIHGIYTDEWVAKSKVDDFNLTRGTKNKRVLIKIQEGDIPHITLEDLL